MDQPSLFAASLAKFDGVVNEVDDAVITTTATVEETRRANAAFAASRSTGANGEREAMISDLSLK